MKPEINGDYIEIHKLSERGEHENVIQGKYRLTNGRGIKGKYCICYCRKKTDLPPGRSEFKKIEDEVPEWINRHFADDPN